MTRLLAAVATLVLLASTASASLLRIELTKATQAKSPVKYSLTTSTASGLVIVKLELPRKQTPLDHLWRIDIVLRKGKGTLLTAPLETKLDSAGTLTTDVILDPSAIKDAEIWIRTGEHAPLAETVYAINVSSFYVPATLPTK